MTERAFISPDISFDWWSGYVTEADRYCKAPEPPATRRSSPQHSNLHRSVCTEHSSGIQFHLLQNKMYFPAPTQPRTEWHPEQIIMSRDIPEFHLLCNTCNAYNISLLITECQPARTIHTPLLHCKRGLEHEGLVLFGKALHLIYHVYT